MKNPAKAIGSVVVLALFLGGMFLLPKAVQNNEKFTKLSEDMTERLPEAPALPVKEVIFQDASQAAAPTPGTGEAAPAAAVPTQPAGPDPVALVSTALAAGDPSKAAAYLDLAKERIDGSTFRELSGLVAAAKDRATKQIEEAAKAAATAAAMQQAVKPVDTAANKALVESQAMLATTLKELQKSQAETSRMVAELRQAPQPTLPAAAPSAAAPITVADSSAPQPGAVVIHFGFDSSVLEQDEANKLGPVVTSLKAAPSAKVQLRGYADKKGNTAYNLGLSQARATSVKDTLRLAGIDVSRVETMPLGSFAASDDAKPEDLRKVEVVIIR
jgi:outer membrane protein OmpA-like peptidoglycan-associated protein